MDGLTIKRCPTCDREVFSVSHGDVAITPPASFERAEAAGNVVAICACGRRVVWFRVRRHAIVSTG